MKHKLPNKAKPCSNCPFRVDTLKGWLGESRIKEILQADSFVCHKTTDIRKTKNSGKIAPLQCAGHMIIKGDNNEFVRLAKRLGIETGLTGQELIFTSEQECINYHKY